MLREAQPPAPGSASTTGLAGSGSGSAQQPAPGPASTTGQEGSGSGSASASVAAPVRSLSAPAGPELRHERLLVGVILLAAAAVRIWRLDLAQVQFDEADAASLVMAWRLDGLFPIAGTVSSVGLAFPPAWPYMLAVGLLVFDSPYALLAIGIAWGLLTVAACWWVARRWLGPWAGFGAAIFYAGGFFPVLLGRSAWQPAFLPLVSLLCLDALLTLAVARRPWALVAACGWFALLVQFHFAAAMYLLMVPIAAWPARRRVRAQHLAAAALAVVVGLLPFVLYELHPGVRLRDLTGILSAPSSNSTPQVDLAIVNYYQNLSSNGGALGLATPSVEELRPRLGRWSSGGLMGSVLAALGAVALVAWWPRGWRAGLIVGWLVLPQLVLLRHTLDVLLHYVYMDLPVLALVAGSLLAMPSAGRAATAAAPAAWARLPRLAWRAVWGGLAPHARTLPPGVATDAGTQPEGLAADAGTQPEGLVADAGTPPPSVGPSIGTLSADVAADAGTPRGPLPADAGTAPGGVAADARPAPRGVAADAGTPPGGLVADVGTLGAGVQAHAGTRAARLGARAGSLVRLAVLALLGVYVAASLGTLWVVLGFVDTADTHRGYGIPLRDSLAAARAVELSAPPGAPVLVGGHHFEAEVLRFSLGYQRSSSVFDDCQALPYVRGAVYLLVSEHTPGAAVLGEAGAALLARIARPGDAYLVYAAPAAPPALASLADRPEQQSSECQDRRVWGRANTA